MHSTPSPNEPSVMHIHRPLQYSIACAVFVLEFVLLLAAVQTISLRTAQAQDTLVVQTLTFDSVGRAGSYLFPFEEGMQFERVVMQYRMRCKNGLVSTSSDRNKGCGEWDYNCETYIIDSSRTDSVAIVDSPYVQKWPQKFEIMSFVTPYGIGLDLGKEGTMWEFDVTDYLPILRGRKGLSVERGAWQEELDIRFLFITGTPPRKVIDITQIWPATEEGYQTIRADTRFPLMRVQTHPEASAFKLRSMITGHGQQGEFEPRLHTLTVNQNEYSREVWKQCSENPIYPQGGTWVYARAGWCPGAATDLAEYDVTADITPGETAEIDYNVAEASGDSRYVVNNQLVEYGAPNFELDAAVVDVLHPSLRTEHRRLNPSCSNPVVTIRNTGRTTLTSLAIEYGVEGGPTRTYGWKGSLQFLQETNVTLPAADLSFWGTRDTGVFSVRVSAPNGGQDMYAQNNSYRSPYVLAPRYSGALVLQMRTNKIPEQNYYLIRDQAGLEVHSGSDFEASTTYYDSIVLSPGCYTFEIQDEGENGLGWWAAPNDGTGNLRLRAGSRTGTTLKLFNPDFGKSIFFDFSIAASSQSGIDEGSITQHISTPQRFRVAPNPARAYTLVSVEGHPIVGAKTVLVELIDITGKSVYRSEVAGSSLHSGGGKLEHRIDLSAVPAGSYLCRMRGDGEEASVRVVVEK